jgi:hypothetical protein
MGRRVALSSHPSTAGRLPVIGLDLLKARAFVTKAKSAMLANQEKLAKEVQFEVRHKTSGV